MTKVLQKLDASESQEPKLFAHPVSSLIPYDIWAVVIACLDFYTLECFTRVCRSFRHEAEKHLWRSCTLRVPQTPQLNEHWARLHLEEGCGVLLRDGRAGCVRDLSLDIEAFLGKDGEADEDFQRTMERIAKVLRHAKRLRGLIVKTAHHHTQLARVLSRVVAHPALPLSPPLSSSTPSPPFRLEGFTTNLFCDEHLFPFWSSQSPSLQHIGLLTLDVGQSPRFPPSLTLPNLNTLNATLTHHMLIMHGTPVTEVVLAGVWEGELGLVKETLCSVKPATIELLQSNAPFSPSPVSTRTSRSRSWRSQSRRPPLRHRSSSSSSSLLTAPHRPLAMPSLGPSILSLRLTIFDSPPTSLIYTFLLPALPYLRFLSLTHADIPFTAPPAHPFPGQLQITQAQTHSHPDLNALNPTDPTTLHNNNSNNNNTNNNNSANDVNVIPDTAPGIGERERALAVLGSALYLRDLEVFEWEGGSGREGTQADVWGALVGLWSSGLGLAGMDSGPSRHHRRAHRDMRTQSTRRRRNLRIIVFRWKAGADIDSSSLRERRFERMDEDRWMLVNAA